MNRTSLTAGFLLSIIVVFLVSLPVFALQKALFIEEEYKHTANNNTTTARQYSYYSENNMLIQNSSWPYTVLINFKQETVFLLNYSNKTYMKMDLKQFIATSAQALGKDTGKFKVVLTKTNKQKQIGSYSCVKYILYFPRLHLKSELWVARNVKTELENYYKHSGTLSSHINSPQLINLLRKTKGIVINSFSDISDNAGIKKIEQKLLKLEIRQVQDSLFSVPGQFAPGTGR